jgi:hypothetical protein
MRVYADEPAVSPVSARGRGNAPAGRLGKARADA